MQALWHRVVRTMYHRSGGKQLITPFPIGAAAEGKPFDLAVENLKRPRLRVTLPAQRLRSTALASSSLRGRPCAPVAVQLRWEELGKIKGGNQFDIKSSPARLKRLRKDPREGIDTVRQDLQSVLQRLDETR